MNSEPGISTGTRRPEASGDALASGEFDFVGARGHILDCAAVDERRFRPASESHARSVDCYVPAADCNHVLGANGRYHHSVARHRAEVESAEKFVCGVDALGVFARDVHRNGLPRTSCDQYGVVAFAQFVEAIRRLADTDSVVDTHAHFFESRDPFKDDFSGETKFGNAVHHNATGEVAPLEDFDRVPHFGELFGGRYARGPESDYRDVFSRRRLARGDGGVAVNTDEVGGKSLERADCHGLAAYAEHARALALLVLVAEASANRGHRGLERELFRRLGDIAVGDFEDEFGNVYVVGAPDLASWLGAVQTARGLSNRRLFGYSVVCFAVVGDADFVRAFMDFHSRESRRGCFFGFQIHIV